jgi:hypothetical protein
MPALYLAGIAIIATAWIEIPKLAKRRW